MTTDKTYVPLNSWHIAADGQTVVYNNHPAPEQLSPAAPEQKAPKAKTDLSDHLRF